MNRVSYRASFFAAAGSAIFDVYEVIVAMQSGKYLDRIKMYFEENGLKKPSKSKIQPEDAE